LARERILVSLAIETTRRTIFSAFTNLKNDEITTKTNYYAFLVKFLHEVTKLSDIINYAADELNKMIPLLIKEIKSKDYGELDYSKYIYPLCRGIEALGILKKVQYNATLKEGVNAIRDILFSEYYYQIEDIKQAIPMLQALLGANLSLRNVAEYRKKFDEAIDRLEELRIEFDPNLKTIYGKDIYFSAKLYKKEDISNTDLAILRADLKSRILIRILKAVEYITAFKRDPPHNIVEFLIRELPKFFNDIFRLVNGKFEYYSTLVESIHNLLSNYNNKNFANALFRTLIEESDWIISEGDGVFDSIKLILGTSLLVASKSAVYR